MTNEQLRDIISACGRFNEAVANMRAAMQAYSRDKDRDHGKWPCVTERDMVQASGVAFHQNHWVPLYNDLCAYFRSKHPNADVFDNSGVLQKSKVMAFLSR